ncbi:acidic leucine-rich nuclear phosphoprotein 32-related protein isoform X2 [Periplaneta americana]|uniref:acidic leucine-rich nuclear phosphoprotein 32-related protein isoform X2 n=1 Tax=Periplaneta americana TaxID=6978 RepID=UPI0037E994EC
MARLTEEMVIARTRASDLSNIRKLNCWGSELSDVSLLRRMHNVEVLSLSVNKIGSLSDFQFCRNLQELYVRKNNIQDLNQVLYLQDLPRLKSLWLEENPCADTDQYRLTVLRALPNLQKLDNIVVQPEEVQDAMRKGRELVHPEELQEQQWASGSSSPAQHEDYYYEDYEESERPAPRTPNVGQRSPPRRHVTNDREVDTTEGRRHSGMIHDEDQHGYYENDRRNANYETDPPMYTRQHSGPYSSPYERSPTSTNSQPEEVSPSESIKDEISCSMAMSSSMPLMKDVSPGGEEMHRSSSGGGRCCHVGQAVCDSSSDGSASSSQYGGRNGRGEEQHFSTQQRVSSSDKGLSNSRPPYPRRPVTRSSNILSAVLCLIKELDYPNLEVVEMAVRSRMDEL